MLPLGQRELARALWDTLSVVDFARMYGESRDDAAADTERPTVLACAKCGAPYQREESSGLRLCKCGAEDSDDAKVIDFKTRKRRVGT